MDRGGGGVETPRIQPKHAERDMTGETVTSLEMLRRLVAFDTTSRLSNLELIDYVRSYLAGHGVASGPGASCCPATRTSCPSTASPGTPIHGR